MNSGITLAERGLVPDRLIRAGIRHQLRRRLRAEEARTASGQGGLVPHLAVMRAGPIAVSVNDANAQHYEVPASLFEAVLGHHLKYSCAYWPGGVQSLDDAEAAMLTLTCERAGIRNGMRVLDLGCGWGALSLWVAEHFPDSQVLAVSNSVSQRHFIENLRNRRGLHNIEVVTADVNRFVPSEHFDRIVSVEMFEHLRNYELVLKRITSWLAPGGRLFVHIFAHKQYPYFFEVGESADWMARYFFTGGMMPSEDLLPACDGPLTVESQWLVGGTHYAQTARAWLTNLDRRSDLVKEVLQRDLGTADGTRWLHRWRLFFLACAELFDYREGTEWRVAHYRLAPREERPDLDHESPGASPVLCSDRKLQIG